MRFAKRVYLIAGIYGLLALLPQYFLEGKTGRDFPPAVTHPEFYYGFIGVALAWQVVFLIMSTDPARYRPLMIPAVLEKAGFGLAVFALYWLRGMNVMMVAAAAVDLLLGALFVAAYLRTAPTPAVENG